MKKQQSAAVFLVIILLLNHLPVFPVNAAKKPTKLAVYELSAENVNKDITDKLTDHLRNNLSRNESFAILSRHEMDQRLISLNKRRNIAQDCNTDACIAEIGGVLGVEMIIIGTISKIRNTYSISLRLVDSEVANTINVLNFKCVCDESELTEKFSEAGFKLLNLGQSKQEIAKPVDRPEAVLKEPQKTVHIGQKPARETLVMKTDKPVIRTTKIQKNSRAWLWWTIGILTVGGVAAAAAGGSGGGSSGGGSSGGDTTPQPPTTGEAYFSWQ